MGTPMLQDILVRGASPSTAIQQFSPYWVIVTMKKEEISSSTGAPQGEGVVTQCRVLMCQPQLPETGSSPYCFITASFTCRIFSSPRPFSSRPCIHVSRRIPYIKVSFPRPLQCFLLLFLALVSIQILLKLCCSAV